MSRIKRFRIGRATAAAGSALLPLLAADGGPGHGGDAAPSPSVVNLYVAPHVAGVRASGRADRVGAAAVRQRAPVRHLRNFRYISRRH